MAITNNFRNETKALTKLAVPLIMTGMVNAPLGFFSTLLLARLGHAQLAAGAIVMWLFSTIMMLLWGVLSAVSVSVAHCYGAGNVSCIARVLRDGFLLALIMSVPLMFLIDNTPLVLLHFGQHAKVVILVREYLRILIWSILPNLIVLVLEQFLIGLGRARVNLWFALIWMPFNVCLSYLLMFGKWGFPELGISGLGWSTTLSMWLLAVMLSIYIYSAKYYRSILRATLEINQPSRLGELVRIGLPIGAMFSVELAFFLMLTLFMGRISPHALAANQIVMQYMGILATITFAIAQAITVRIGHNIGAKDIDKISYTTASGVMIGGVFALIIASTYWLFPTPYIAVDLNIHAANNQEIIKLAKQIFAVAAIFQLLEAARIGLFGALRGIGDTRFALWSSVFIFWWIAFPLGYFFAKVLHWQGVGFWWGITLASACGSVLFALRFRYAVKIRHSHQQR
jgi:MATE family multidrug resistance protein